MISCIQRQEGTKNICTARHCWKVYYSADLRENMTAKLRSEVYLNKQTPLPAVFESENAWLTIQHCQGVSCAERHGCLQQRHWVACDTQRREYQCDRWAPPAEWAQSDLSPQRSGASQPEPPPWQQQGLWRADASRCIRGPWGLDCLSPGGSDKGMRIKAFRAC